MSENEWETYRTHENARLRNYRNPAKDGSCAKCQPYPYRSAQTLGNAAKECVLLCQARLENARL